MDKLFKIKQWLLLGDAAERLSKTFEERVTEADILQLALQGRLRLSANFVNGQTARPGTIVPYDKAKTFSVTPPGFDAPEELLRGVQISQTEVFDFDDDSMIGVSGIWDLPMIGGECLDIEHRYHLLTGGPEVTGVVLDGVFVASSGGRVCQLQARFDKQRDGREGFYPAGGLPDDVVIVVRPNALAEFEASLNDSPPGPPSPDRPLATRARRTYLTIIAAQRNLLEAKGRGEIKTLVSETERMGARVSEDTVAKILREVPDAVESRQS